MNNKGFALTETLVVVVFLVSIFTFVYISINPLIGKYEDVINREKDIDIVYKLYHVRKLIMSESETQRAALTANGVRRITCSNLDRVDFCNKLMEQVELRKTINNTATDYYVLIYASSLSNANISEIRNINGEIGEYADKYKSKITEKALFLLDTNKHTIAHLYYDDSV